MLPKESGYRGIWYYNQPTNDEYVYKYAGGLGTYPQSILPMAVYSPEARKTFFCYGGSASDSNRLLHMVSYYDHRTGLFPRPAVLLDKLTDDAHDNPSLALDADGRLIILSNSHGVARPAYIHRSREPWSIDDFERVYEGNFSYAQPWHIPGRGLLVLHTLYKSPPTVGQSRCLHFMTSPDGVTFSQPTLLSHIEKGHYHSSLFHNGTFGAIFDMHPFPAGLNFRTNLYYVQTTDFGQTWTNAAGERLALPLTECSNPALVYECRSKGLVLHIKTLQYDRANRPVILFLTSKGWEPGPKNDPRTWHTAQWTGSEWHIRPVTTSDNNYDYGPMYIEPDNTWRIIAPIGVGPQPGNPGGEIQMWTCHGEAQGRSRASTNEGSSWTLSRQMTMNSPYNHTFVQRPVNAQPDFYGFWADGHARQQSPSRLYFCDREANVFQMPTDMNSDFAKPIPYRPGM